MFRWIRRIWEGDEKWIAAGMILRTIFVRDKCEFCFGMKGGVRGNENVHAGGALACDYCSALLAFVQGTMRAAEIEASKVVTVTREQAFPAAQIGRVVASETDDVRGAIKLWAEFIKRFSETARRNFEQGLAQETEALAKLWADAGISRLEAKVGEMEAAKDRAGSEIVRCSSHTQTANHGAIRCDRGSGHDGEHVAMEGLVGEVTWGEPKAKDHDPSTRAVEETAVPVIERCPMAFARKDAYSLGLLGGDAGVEAVRCARDAGHAGEHLGTRPGLDRVVRW